MFRRSIASLAFTAGLSASTSSFAPATSSSSVFRRCGNNQAQHPAAAAALLLPALPLAQVASASSRSSSMLLSPTPVTLKRASSKKDGGKKTRKPRQSKQDNAEAAEQQQEQQQEQQTTTSSETALVSKDMSNSIPTTGTVEDYARVALRAEGRDGIVEAQIWAEETCYYPILAQGKRNIYERTDDIPAYVTPAFGETQIWQTREYFEYRRKSENIWYRIATIGSGFLVFFGIAGGVAFTRIWVDQPSEVATLRRTLLNGAYGRVLELAAGQGINIGVYPFAVTDVVLVDSNPQELHILRSRLPRTAYPTYQVVCDKAEELRSFPDHCFDTVVDMFGLCHYRDPVQVLKQMQRVCKPTGTLLLLEHGRSDYTLVNWFLDWRMVSHFESSGGCTWNRDLRQVFKEAGLVIRDIETQHYGTTYIVVAHPEVAGEAQHGGGDLPLTAGGELAQPVMAV